MDISLASSHLPRQQTQVQSASTDQTQLQKLRTPDSPAPPSQRSDPGNVTSDVDPRLSTDPKLAAEQTLKPYGTLLLPYRGADSTISLKA